MAIEDIHDQGLIHRDLNPKNLIFDKESYLNVIDFGNSSKVPDDTYQLDLNYSGFPLSPLFILFPAPELVFNQPYGKEVDFYSLGMILYNILLKKFPYDAKTREELKYQMENKSPHILIKELPL